MCDDWDDLIEYVVQKFLRNFQTGGCYDVDSPQRSLSGSPDGSPLADSETQQQQFDSQAEQTTGDDDPFFDVPRTDIESLMGQLKDSGLFCQLLSILKPSFLRLSRFTFRISKTARLDSIFFIGFLFSSFGHLQRPRIP